MTPYSDVRPAPPQLLLLGSIASVQFGAAFADQLFGRAGPGGVVLLRLLLSAAVLLPLARPSLRGRSRADVMAVVGFGVVLAGMNWSFYEGLNRLPLGVAVTVEFTGPLALAVAGSRRALDLLWAGLAAGGVALLALRGQNAGVQPLGVGLTLVAGACWACYILLSKRVGAAFASLDGLALALCVGSVLVLPAGLVEGVVQRHGALVESGVVAGGFAVAMLSSLIPYSLEIVALRRLKASTFGLLMSLEPAVAALAGVVVLGQRLSPVLLGALAMVVAASVGTTLADRRPVTAPDGEPDPLAVP